MPLNLDVLYSKGPGTHIAPFARLRKYHSSLIRFSGSLFEAVSWTGQSQYILRMIVQGCAFSCFIPEFCHTKSLELYK